MNMVTVAQYPGQVDPRPIRQIDNAAGGGNDILHAAAKWQGVERPGLMDCAGNVDQDRRRRNGWRGRRCWNRRMNGDDCRLGAGPQQQRRAQSDQVNDDKKQDDGQPRRQFRWHLAGYRIRITNIGQQLRVIVNPDRQMAEGSNIMPLGAVSFGKYRRFGNDLGIGLVHNQAHAL